MSKNSSKSKWIVWPTLAVLAVLTALSVYVRVDEEAPGDRLRDGPSSTGVTAFDPMTGAILIDIDDDASDEEQMEVAARVASAIAPFDWPTELRGLGRELNDEANLFRLYPPASEVDDVLEALADDENVELVEIERTWSLPQNASRGFSPLDVNEPAPADDSDRFVPNDPYYNYQWHLDQIGMPQAWTRTRGAGVVVAIIDTGVAFRDEGGFMRAPDLADTNIVQGYDFVQRDDHPDDEHGHGTHVAGTVAQSTNNGVGVAGVAPEASIMPLKVLDRNGTGGWGGIAAAIRYAADNGAHVINMSLGGGMPSRAVQRAIDHAHDEGVLVIAAAGNASRDRVEYPARHRHVVAVGAVRYDRELTFYSCYGEGLDVVAPGGDLRVDQNDDGMPDGVLQNTMVQGDTTQFDYLAWQGTSMAAPHAAGVGALIYASGIQDPDAAEHILVQSADDLGDPHRYAAGLINAEHAVQLASQGTGAARGAAAIALSLLLLLGLRRRNRLAVSPWRATGWAVLVAGGLAALPWQLIPGLGGASSVLSVLGSGLFGGGAALLGPYGALLLCTVLPAFGAVAMALHVKRLRPLLTGLALGSGAFLLVEALWPSLRLAVLPDAVVGPWLLLNGVLAVGLGVLVARRAPDRHWA